MLVYKRNFAWKQHQLMYSPSSKRKGFNLYSIWWKPLIEATSDDDLLQKALKRIEELESQLSNRGSTTPEPATAPTSRIDQSKPKDTKGNSHDTESPIETPDGCAAPRYWSRSNFTFWDTSFGCSMTVLIEISKAIAYILWWKVPCISQQSSFLGGA